ncbi:MAG: DUF1430 domain-containing protein [Clostridium sp.]
MKRAITVLLLLISMFSFFILFNETKEIQKSNMKNAERYLITSKKIIIPTSITLLDIKEQYNLLVSAAKEAEVSIFFSRIDQTNENETIKKYIYCQDDSYFNEFVLDSGRLLNKNDMESELFISTNDVGDKKQIGKIITFNNSISMEIHTLKSMVNDGMILNGECIISANSIENMNKFTKILCERLKVDSIQISNIDNISINIKDSKLQIGGLFFIIMLLIFYHILKSYKAIAIKKMLGYSILDIWKEYLVNIVKINILVIIFTNIFISIFVFKEINSFYYKFIASLFLKDLLFLGILIITISIPFLYARNINASVAIKNRQAQKQIIIFNNVVKCMLAIGLIYLINIQVSNYSNIKLIFDGTYKRWDNVSNYVTLNFTRLEESIVYSDKFRDDSKEIYKYFNEKGAIFADFSWFTDLMKANNKEFPVYNRFCTVNPNYLLENPVYDLEDKRVYVSEDDVNWTMLVPEKYKNDERSIREYSQLWMSGYDEKFRKDIRIIWVKSNQRYFTYNFEINPLEGNYVIDPVILMGTENGGLPGWNSQIFNVQGNPFKAKIDEGKSADETVRPIIDKFNYSSYGLQLNYANEQVKSNFNDYKELLIWSVISILILLTTIILVLVQNIFNFFYQYKLLLAVRHIHGYDLVEKYFEYYSIVIISWIITISTVMIFKLAPKELTSIIFLIGFFIEILISLIIFKFLEKNEIMKNLKKVE